MCTSSAVAHVHVSGAGDHHTAATSSALNILTASQLAKSHHDGDIFHAHGGDLLQSHTAAIGGSIAAQI